MIAAFLKTLLSLLVFYIACCAVFYSGLWLLNRFARSHLEISLK